MRTANPTLREAAFEGFLLLGVTAGLGFLLAFVLAIFGWPTTEGLETRIYTLDDGSRLAAGNEEDAYAKAEKAGREITGVTVEARGIFGGNLLFSGVLAGLCALVLVTWIQARDRIVQWLTFDRGSVGWGVAGGAALFLVAWGIEAALSLVDVAPPDVVAIWREAVPTLGWLPIVVLIVAPFAEELYFRGRLWEAADACCGGKNALWLTSAAFALVHVIPLYVPIYFLLGIVLGLLRRRTGGVAAPLLAHLVFNALRLLAA